MISFKISNDNDDKVVIEFELCESGVITPDELKTVAPPDLVKSGDSNKLLILSGRGPIWLYCYLTHFYHVCRAIAVFDPRLQAAIVVQTHDASYQVGDIVKM